MKQSLEPQRGMHWEPATVTCSGHQRVAHSARLSAPELDQHWGCQLAAKPERGSAGINGQQPHGTHSWVYRPIYEA